jgi:hypothetical protein
MSGPITDNDDISAESILFYLFPKIDLRVAPATEEEQKDHPEILVPQTAGGREEPNEEGRLFIDETIKWLNEKLPQMAKNADTDLLNIRDKIVDDLNKVKTHLTRS